MLGEWVNGGGYGLLTWSTHGWYTSASGLMVSADNVHLNDSTPAFTFQGSCLNGYPEVPDNLGYSLLRQGAIGTVSASRVSYNLVFNPASDPNPLSGSNANLTYHYTTRMMQDRAAGHALYLTKSNVNPTSSWMNKMDYNLYGDPSAALMRTIAGVDLLFDTSGSMSWSHEGIPGVPLAEQRLSLAKEAAYPFMQLLNDHAHTRANFGITVFPPHPWSSAVGCNGQVVTPMTRVDAASTTTAVSTTIPGLVAEGNTPLLAGLEAAVTTFTTETPRAIVLLSDGYHNCPSVVGAMDPAVDTLIGQLNAASVQVYTIGFGRPTDIDHPLLNRLAGETDGEFYDVTTAAFDPATWSPATDLQATYKAILVDALGLETAVDPMAVIAAGKTDSHEVRINEYDNRVSVFLSWKTPQTGRLSLRIKTSDGLDIPATAATPGVTPHQGNTYQIVTLDREFLNQAGKVGPTPWILEVGAGQLDSGESEHYQYSVIVDSGLKMDMGFARDGYQVGDSIVVEAAIKVDRRPLTGLSDVVAKVTGPEEGLGNWFALNAVSAEAVKKIPEERNGERLSRIQRKATYLTDVRKIGVPARRAPNEIHLFDDGTHGDALAGDGVYSGTVTNTAKEGSYILQVRASGPTAAGNGFDRDTSLQTYLTPRIVAEHIGIIAVRVDSQESKLQRFQLTVTPKDALGNFLGPRYAGAIKLAAEPKGRFLEMVDNLDGSYSQVLELPEGVSVRDVKIRLDAQEATLEFNLRDKLKPSGLSRIVWLLLLLAFIIVVVWILLRRRST